MRSYRLAAILGFGISVFAWASEVLTFGYDFSKGMYNKVLNVFLDTCYGMPPQLKEPFGLGKANTIGRTWEPKESTNYRGNKKISMGVYIHSNSLCM